MNNKKSRPLLSLPDWIDNYAQEYAPTESVDERMQFVIGAAKQNLVHLSGGPFAAAIFEEASGKLISLGVNLVTSHNNAILHAEVVAIMLAQQSLQTFDLAKTGLARHELVSSSEPCAMCIGATNWSGVHRLIYGANIADACAIGFDEGPVSSTWKEELRSRGIEIIPERLRDQAVSVLQFYKEQNGIIYNGGETHRG